MSLKKFFFIFISLIIKSTRTTPVLHVIKGVIAQITNKSTARGNFIFSMNPIASKSASKSSIIIHSTIKKTSTISITKNTGTTNKF